MRFSLRLVISTALLMAAVYLAICMVRHPMAVTPSQKSDEFDRQPVSDEVLIHRIHLLAARNTLVTYDQLKTSLWHPSSQVRYMALRAAENDISSAMADYLTDRILRDPSPEIRSYALKLLSRQKVEEMLPYVAVSLMDPSLEVQDTALGILIHQHRIDAVPTIIELAESDHPTQGQMRALSALGGEAAIQYLVKIISDDPVSREEAIFWLAQAGSDALPSIREKLLGDNDCTACEAILPVFIWLQTDQAFRMLKNATASRQYEICRRGITGLGYMATPESYQYLLELNRKNADRRISEAIDNAIAIARQRNNGQYPGLKYF